MNNKLIFAAIISLACATAHAEQSAEAPPKEKVGAEENSKAQEKQSDKAEKKGGKKREVTTKELFSDILPEKKSGRLKVR